MAKIFEAPGDQQKMDLIKQPNLPRVNSSSAVANKLYQNGQKTASRRGSIGSESDMMTFSDSEMYSEINDISSQVSTISKKLNEMEEMQVTSGEEKSRLKTDNAVLQERVHVLEEQLQSTEERWKEKFNEEKMRNKDLQVRLEREKQLELESWSLKYQVLGKEHGSCVADKSRLTDEIHRLQTNMEQLQQDMIDSKILAEQLESDRVKVERDYRRYRVEAQQDIDSSSELVEELSRQTDELRQQRQLPKRGSMAEQMMSLEEERQLLRGENRRLKEEKEDLQAQLLHDSVEKGRSLLASGGLSLADELNGKDRNELINALKEQEICNQKLRAYINGILLRVIELHPEILEIKHGEQAPPPSIE